MASIDTGGGGGGGRKGSPKRLNTRVDFTPMVDMNMLLLTFFMFCTTLSKPQVMKLAMPVPEEDVNMDNQKADTKDSQAYTFILDEDNKIYYYQGKLKPEDYQDYTKLKETEYPTKNSNGFRQILLEKNAKVMQGMKELRAKREKDKRMTEEDFEKAAAEIKKEKDDAPVIVIKAVRSNVNGEGIDKTKGATYKNLIDVLDEMAICSIGRYAIVDMTAGDEFVLKNFKTKGAYGQEQTAPEEPQGKKKRR